MAHPTVLTGMTWDHPRGFESVVACNDLIKAEFGVTVEWSARSLLQFGDQHVREFAEGRDLMVIDHPHVPDAVVDGAVIAMDDLVDQDTLERLARESAGPSHESYRFRGKIWALAIDAATQVSVYRPIWLTVSRHSGTTFLLTRRPVEFSGLTSRLTLSARSRR